MRIKYKITFAFVLLTTIVLAALCILTYQNTKLDQEKDFSIMLHNRALTISSLLFSSGSLDYNLLSKVDSATKNLLFKVNVNIFNSQNKCIYRFARNSKDTVNIPVSLLDKARNKKYLNITINNKNTVAIYYKESDLPFIITVSAIDENGHLKLEALKWNLFYGFNIGLILSFVFGLFFSNRILKPLIQISNKVNTITASNIEERLPVTNLKDEWNKLATTFNNLLSRLKESFELQGRFIANASHELSTPLTSVSNQIDVILRKERTNEKYLHVLKSVQTDVNNLSALTQQLLNIARTSTSGLIQAEDVRVDELLMEIPSILKKTNPKYTVSVFFDELPEEEMLCVVKGNHELLLSAFKNLAENGCKYSPDHHVKISLSFIENKILVLLANTCELIKQDEIDNLFQPFQRGSNSHQTKGYGLGLSLTRRIILLHKGEIEAELNKDNNILISVILRSSL